MARRNGSCGMGTVRLPQRHRQLPTRREVRRQLMNIYPYVEYSTGSLCRKRVKYEYVQRMEGDIAVEKSKRKITTRKLLLSNSSLTVGLIGQSMVNEKSMRETGINEGKKEVI